MTFQFKCDSTNGFQEISGSISFNENNLLFEYQANHLGLIKGEVKELVIPFSQINSIDFIDNFFSKYILINLNSLKNLGKFQLVDEYKIKIPVKRKFKESANEFIISANFNYGQYKLNNL